MLRDKKPAEGLQNAVLRVGARFSLFLALGLACLCSSPTLLAQAPSIDSPPQSQIVYVSNNVSLSVTAEGAAPLSYQWFFDNASLTGDTNSILTFSNVTPVSQGTYTVVVSNSAGSVTSAPATLIVNAPFYFLTLAGQAGQTGNANGVGSAALFNNPTGVAVDGAGNIYVVDSGNNAIRVITPAGAVSTLRTGISYPSAIALDSNDDVYLSYDNQNQFYVASQPFSNYYNGGYEGAEYLGEITPGGAFGQLPVQPLPSPPQALALDQNGNLYGAVTFPGGSSFLLKISSGGMATVLATLNNYEPCTGVAVDGFGDVYLANQSGNSIQYVSATGGVTTVATGLAVPNGLALDSLGNVYVTANYGVIEQRNPNGMVQGIAGGYDVLGSADGVGSAAHFYDPRGIAVDSAGNLYVADTQNNTIRKGVAYYGQPIATPPAIASAPKNLTEAATYTAEFSINAYSVVAIPAAPMSYQWSFDGTNIAGATNSTLTVSHLTPAQAGTYSVVATNYAGSVTSAPVTLTVTAPLSVATVTNLSYVPNFFAMDGNGNFFLYNNLVTHPIQEITPAGLVNTLAVNGIGAVVGMGVNSSDNIFVVESSYLGSPFNYEGNYFTAISTGGSSDTYGLSLTNQAFGGVAVDQFTNMYATYGGGVVEFSYQASSQVWPQYDWSEATIAGLPGSFGYVDSDEGPAQFDNPTGLALGPAGIYVADTGNSAIRILQGGGGYVTTLAGGTAGSADGVGTNAQFNTPRWLAVDSSGNVYVTGDGRIRKITPDGTVTTVAGGGEGGGTTGSEVSLGVTQGIAVDSSGNVFFADGELIREAVIGVSIVTQPQSQTVGVSNTVSFSVTAAGTAPYFYQWQFDGAAIDGATNTILTLTNVHNPASGSYTVVVSDFASTVTSAAATLNVTYPQGVPVDPAILEYESSQGLSSVNVGGGVVYSVQVTGSPPTFQWFFDGTNLMTGATNATLALSNMVPSQAGTYSVVVSNAGGSITSTPITLAVNIPLTITTFAGLAGHIGTNNGLGQSAEFLYPESVAVDSSNNVYVADTHNHSVREITPGALVSTLAQAGADFGYDVGGYGGAQEQQSYVYGVAVATNGNVYAALYQNLPNANQGIWVLQTNGYISSLAYLADNTTANWPTSVAVDQQGNAYAAMWNDTIVKISPGGVVSNLAGLAGASGFADGLGTSARFDYPYGIAVDGSNNVYVADSHNHAIRFITPAGLVSTLAGGTPGFADGIGTNAQFYNPQGVAVDGLGNVYVADTYNETIRLIAPGGAVSTVAGLQGNEGSADGVGTNAQFIEPQGITVDGGGNIYIADTYNSTIRKGVYGAYFLSQPQSQTVGVGSNVSFSVTVAGAAPITYQWQYNGENLSGATNATLTLTNVHNAVAGSYTVQINNVGGSALSATAILTVTYPQGVPVDPGIVQSPVAELVGLDGVAVLSVTADGSLPLTYQWVFDGTNVLAGATNSSLTLTNLLPSEGGAYSVVVSNAGGSITTAPVTLTVNVPLAFVTLAGLAQATGTSNGVGSAARFNEPLGVALDSAGNVYVADTYNQTIREITPAGAVTTLAGQPGTNGDVGGNTSVATFYNPTGVAVDSNNYVYVADTENYAIRMIVSVGAQKQVVPLATGLSGQPLYVAVDGSGNVYATLTDNTVAKISQAGTVTNFAGLSGNYGFVNGQGTSARFNAPEGIAVDGAGNVYVADTANGAIRLITPAGLVSTLAGGTYGTNDGFGTNAQFDDPHGVAVDALGNVFVADSDNSTIREISPSGFVYTVAGTPGVSGSSNGIGSAALFSVPADLAVDSAGNVYVADTYNSIIRKSGISPYIVTPPQNQFVAAFTSASLTVTAGGTQPFFYQWQFDGTNVVGATNATLLLTSVPLTAAGGYAVIVTNAFGAITSSVATLDVLTAPPIITSPPQSFTESATYGASFSVGLSIPLPYTYQWLFDGSVLSGATNTTLTFASVTTNEAGSYAVKVTDSAGSVTSTPPVILTVNPALDIFTLAGMAGNGGTNDGTGSAARFSSVYGVALDSAGNIYVADNNMVRKVTPSGVVITLAGAPASNGSMDGAGSAARFSNIQFLAVDSAGNIYVSDTSNSTIRKVTPGGVVTTLAGCALCNPGNTDGTGSAARFDGPGGIAVDRLGNLFVADVGNNTIRQVTPVGTNWVVTTLAGPAGFSLISGLALDSSGNLYVADDGNHTLHKVTPVGTNWVVTTIAGQPGNYGTADGFGNAAQFRSPEGVAVDSANNVYVADTDNSLIRKVAPVGTNWVVTTLAGSGLPHADGTGSAAGFNSPWDVAVDGAGSVYVADLGNNTLRKGVPYFGQPIITNLPASQMVWAQSNVTLTASVQSAAPVSYQWQLNGLNVAGATTSALSLTNALRSTAGSYTIIVSNISGVVTSWPPAVVTVQAPLTVFTLAGRADTSGTNDGTGSAARFNGPQRVATDKTGNVYVSDWNNNTIRKIAPSGVVTTFAGQPGMSGSNNGPASMALFNGPIGLAVDGSNNVYVGDVGNNELRVITPEGFVSTLAGEVEYPADLAVDSLGNVYVADGTSETILEISPGGVVTTLAGRTGVKGSTDGVGVAALFNSPDGVGLDSAGNIYVSDYGNDTIRKIAPGEVVTTFAGAPGSQGSVDGTGSAAQFYSPAGLTVNASGNIYVADSGNNTIRLITPDGVVSTVAGLAGTTGSADGTGSAAQFGLDSPNGVAVDGAGNIYVADERNNAIRKGVPNYGQPIITNISTNQIVILSNNAAFSVMAFNNPPLAYQWQFNGANLPNATNATLNLPNVQPANGGSYVVVITNYDGAATSAVMTLTVALPPAIVAQPQPNLVAPGQGVSFSVAATGSGVLSYQWLFNGISQPIITVAGNGTSSYAGDGVQATNTGLNGPSCVILDPNGNLFVSDEGNSCVRRIAPNGIISTVAGNGSFSFSGDGGPATNASLYAPNQIALDASGNLFIADEENNRIRKVGTNGIISTVAGNGTAGWTGDNGPATSADLNKPDGLVFDINGNLYIADSPDSRIREVGTNGIIVTPWGNGTLGFSGDGGLADYAEFNSIGYFAVDAIGNFYVADVRNNRVREIGTNGIITTIVGNGSAAYAGDGGPAISASLNNPNAASFDSAGNLFIADTQNNCVREVSPAGIIITIAGNGIGGFSGDRGSATAAELHLPDNVAVDPNGNAFIADDGNNRVREVINLNVNQPTLALQNIPLALAGSYSVVVTSAYGSITSSVAALAVEGTAVTSANINSTWTSNNSPYVVGGNFSVNNLTIQPGVSVWFNGPYSLTVTGTLNAVGTSNNPITFSGVGWQGLRFVSASTNTNNTMSWCVVSDAVAGGIRFTNTPFTLNSCVISSNSGVSGGGIYSDSALYLTNCSLLGNSAAYSQQGSNYFVQGGGLFSLHGGATLVSCLVSNNTAIMPDIGNVIETSTGGGIDCEAGTLTLNDCVIVSNQAAGAGLSATALGGGVYMNSATAAFNATGCTFTGNSASGGFGGGASLGGAGLLACAFSGNSATFGGALYTGGSGQTMATNLLLVSNIAVLGGAVYSTAGQAAGDFENCTLVYNSRDGFNGYTGLIHDSILVSNGTEIVPGLVNPVVKYCDVQGGYSGLGNLNADPLFLDTTDFLLSTNYSPCANAGDPATNDNNGAYPPADLNDASDVNDMGAYGGPGGAFWPQFANQVPAILVNGQPASPYEVLTFTNTSPPTLSFSSDFAGGSYGYTLDGSNPLGDFNYGGPFVLSNSATVRVVVYSADYTSYAVTAPVYINLPPAYPLAASTAGGGSVSPTGGSFLSNSVATLTATASNGWQFLYWTNGVSGTNTTLAVAVTGTLTNIQAVFGTALTTHVTPLASFGTVQSNPALAYYPYGSTVQLTAIPATGRYFTNWTETGVFTSFVSPLDLIVTNASPSVTALFGNPPAGQFSLNLSVTGTGDVSRNPQQPLYASNAVVAVAATPAAGWTFTGWTGNVAGSASNLNVTLTSNVSMTANFVSSASLKGPPSITIISPTNDALFTTPTNISLTATATDTNTGGFLTNVAFYAGTNLLGVVTNFTNSSFSFVWSNAFLGTNDITAEAYDNFGLSALSAPVNLIVSLPPPGPPVFTLSGGLYAALENAGTVTVTVEKNSNSLGGTVHYATSDGTALAYSNYQAVAGSLVFAEGDTAKTVSVPIIDNTIYEGNTTFGFSLSPSGDGSTVGTPGSATITIIDVNNPLATNPPVFAFSSTNYVCNEAGGAVTLTVVNSGYLGGVVSYQTADGTALGGSGFSGSYTISSGNLTFSNNQASASIIVPIMDNFLDGPALQFSVQLFNPSAGTLGSPATASVTILLNDAGAATNSLLTTAAPGAQPAMNAQLTVLLTPTNAGGQWRFPWDLGWRNSGDTVANLIAGNYPLEFRVVPDYLPYPSTLTVTLNSGANTVSNAYYATVNTSDPGSLGSLTVNIPGAPSGAGWQFLGQAGWLSPGATASGLLPGTYFITFEPVSGDSTPANQTVEVFGGENTAVTASYLAATTAPNGVALPQLISPASSIPSVLSYPYGFNGQLQTDVGFGSGVAARASVVLTAAHLVFNDETLAYVNNAWWSFQQETNSFEPEPLAARGWYVLSGYAAQRTSDLTAGGLQPDQSSAASRDLDVAALYFLSPAARTGYGGYLSSDVTPNPYLTGSSLKMVVGYPVDGSLFGQVVSAGSMYATPQGGAVSPFAQANDQVYTASWLLSYPGNSGGAVYVQYPQKDYFYPAAVYLGTLTTNGSYVTAVRAIDSNVVNLINLAASEGDAGTNNSGGGVITVIAEGISSSNPGILEVTIVPPAAFEAGGAWKLSTLSDAWYSTQNPSVLAVTNTNSVELQLMPIAGWNLPTNQSVSLLGGSLESLTAIYTPVIAWPSPAAIPYGTALGSNQLDASVTVAAGTYNYNPPAGTVLSPGTNTLSVTFTPDDTAEYGGASTANVSLVVLPAPPVVQAVRRSGNAFTFTWSAVSNQVYQIQFATNLTQTHWTTLAGTITATNSSATMTEAISNNARQFYRVVLLP